MLLMSVDKRVSSTGVCLLPASNARWHPRRQAHWKLGCLLDAGANEHIDGHPSRHIGGITSGFKDCRSKGGCSLVCGPCWRFICQAQGAPCFASLPKGPAYVGSRVQVISSTEDIPSRCFGAWYCSFINTASAADVMDPCDATT